MISITSPEMLGKRLRQYRKEQGLSQSDAGKEFNITQKIVSNIESGLPGIQLATLFKLMSSLRLEIHLEPRDKNSKEKDLW